MKFLQNIKSRGLMVGVLSMSLIASMLMGTTKVMAAQKDYGSALKQSVLFYDANKCGPLAGENNAFSWRSACHIHDGSDKGVDLTGGFHDCGDHVKFGITQNYAASVLGWSYYDYKKAFEVVGNKEKMYSTLKYATDYLLKCHPNANTFYYQVGDGNVDHSYWGSPELQGNRQTYYTLNSNSAGSDIAGGASAALAIMYLNSKDVDTQYANKCLAAAKSLYVLGTQKEGIAPYQSFYQSSSYKDDLAWAATWLYRATKDKKYLVDAEKFMTSPYNKSEVVTNEWTMCWDNMYIPTALELYKITGQEKYKKAVTHNMQFWFNNINTTKGGLKVLNSWGSLRYSAAASAIAMEYYNLTGDTRAKHLALSQINYILGDNPMNMSYVIGYGSKYPTKPHHRAANGYQGYANNNNLKEAKYVLTGALVGGPGNGDSYSNNANQYTETEVGIDYNAGLVMALAGLITNGEIGTSEKVDSTIVENISGTKENGTTGIEEAGTAKLKIDSNLNSWGSGYTCSIRVQNQTSNTVEDWKVKVLKADFTLTNSWNCSIKEEGKYLIITPASYNRMIGAHGCVEFGLQGTGPGNTNFWYSVE